MNKVLNNLWREASALELLRAPWRHFAAIYNPSADRWQLGGWTAPQKHAQLNRYDNDQEVMEVIETTNRPFAAIVEFSRLCSAHLGLQFHQLAVMTGTEWRQVDGGEMCQVTMEALHPSLLGFLFLKQQDFLDAFLQAQHFPGPTSCLLLCLFFLFILRKPTTSSWENREPDYDYDDEYYW